MYIIKLLLVTALLATVAAVVQTRRYLSFKRLAARQAQWLRRRKERFSDVSQVLKTTEQLGDFGHWQYFPREDRQLWSRTLREFFGLQTQDEMKEGDAETLLASNGINLVELAHQAIAQDKIISSIVRVRGLDGERRILEMRMCKMPRARDAGERVFAVFLDVTRQYEREEQLQHSQRKAIAEARRAREQANRDPLTNLANRRRVMGELDRLLSRARAAAVPVSMVPFDVDHFKSVNDEFGHLAGDTVLRRLARIASEQAREGDLVGRIGGEEFAWIMPGADRRFVQVISERLRRAVALGSAIPPLPPVTISIGCVIAELGDSSLSLFARADEALYQAKNGGRNTVRMAA
ncbi:diguanylate cyclase [Altererythrobacter sp. GH1-8]|uniref:GGDEF domain-containing protein n=1 Tax=Altererythrobacter sp. GH1-8 TaxID=3349333 RepID=UPI00374DA588